MTSHRPSHAGRLIRRICAVVLLFSGAAYAANDVQVTTLTNPAAPEAGKIVYTTFHIVNNGPEALSSCFVKLTLPGGNLVGCSVAAFLSNSGTPNLMTGQFPLAVGASKSITVFWTAFTPGDYTMDSEVGWMSASETGLPKYAITTTVAADSGKDLPSVALNHPTHGGTYAAGSTILLEALVDDRGTGTGDRFGVAKVEFYAGTTRLGEDTVKPYAFNWLNVPAGTYALTAVATDDDATASKRTSLPVTITVAGGSVNEPPTVARSAKATPNPVTAKTCVLSVLGADDGGEGNLTYTWSATTAPAAVSFSANGTNAAKSTTVTFSKAGAYTFQVTIKDPQNLSVTSSVNVTVNKVLSSITVSPGNATLAVGESKTFTAVAKDQFGANMSASIAWSVNGGGTIGSTGVFNATTVGGPFTVKASSGGKNGSASVTVISANQLPVILSDPWGTPNPVRLSAK